MSSAPTARSPWPDMNIKNTNLFKGTLKNHFTFPSVESGLQVVPEVSKRQSEANLSLVAEAPHNQVFVMFCCIDIGNGGLIKAVVLIQRNPNLSCGGCPLLSSPLPLSPSLCRYNLKPSQWSSFCRNWNRKFGMSWLRTVMLRFSATTQLSILLCTIWHRQHFFVQVPSSHVWLHKHAAITFSFGSRTISWGKLILPRASD